MKQLLFFFYFTLLWSCNNHQSISKIHTDTSMLTQASVNANIDTNRTKMDTGDNDNDLKNIVNQFLDEYKKDYNLDSSFNVGIDSFRLIFKYAYLANSNIHIPEKYVSIYGLQEFVAHDFESLITIYKNNKLIVNKKVTKESFSGLIDDNLNLYGVLLYPEIHVDKEPIVANNYSISIPLTDIGKSVGLTVESNGNVSIKRN